jgi:hypothetical protein
MAFGSQSKSKDTRTREELLDLITELQHDNTNLAFLLHNQTERTERVKKDAKEALSAYRFACRTIKRMGKTKRGEYCPTPRKVRHPLEGIRP